MRCWDPRNNERDIAPSHMKPRDGTGAQVIREMLGGGTCFCQSSNRDLSWSEVREGFLEEVSLN